jgi:hypothetical protein
MRKIVTISFAAGLLAAALPASAADTGATAVRSETTRDQPQANGAAARERQICVREPSSETRIRRTVCHTAREWRDQQGNEDLDRH